MSGATDPSELTAPELIWNDVADRSGGEDFLASIDPETRGEILERWRQIIDEEHIGSLGEVEGKARTLEEAENFVRRVGRTIGHRLPAGWGFVLIATQYGEGGNLTYVTSVHRSTVPALLREFASNLESGENNLSPKALQYDDPVLAKALELLDVLRDVWTCPGVRLVMDPKAISDGPGGMKQARVEAEGMKARFREVVQLACDQAGQLFESYPPPRREEAP